jgi:hypothetical protein
LITSESEAFIGRIYTGLQPLEQWSDDRAATQLLQELGARIELFQERCLLGAELERLLGVLLLERQPALVARAEALVVEDLLDGDRRQPPPSSAKSALSRLQP